MQSTGVNAVKRIPKKTHCDPITQTTLGVSLGRIR